MFPPTYRNLQYADSLEGTDASLMKYRRKTQISQGSTSIILQVTDLSQGTRWRSWCSLTSFVYKVYTVYKVTCLSEWWWQLTPFSDYLYDCFAAFRTLIWKLEESKIDAYFLLIQTAISSLPMVKSKVSRQQLKWERNNKDPLFKSTYTELKNFTLLHLSVVSSAK